MIHFLHIGKTGGTAIREALGGLNTEYVFHPHSVRLIDIPVGEKVVFHLREPLSRFRSGFYSRLRKGQPRYFFDWSKSEELAFSQFASPEDLLAGAVDQDKRVRGAAEEALKSIQHVRDHYDFWLHSNDYIKSRSADILHVGFLELLQTGFEELKMKLRVSKHIELPSGEVSAHRNPAYPTRSLSAVEYQYFRNRYQADFEIYEYCSTHWRLAS